MWRIKSSIAIAALFMLASGTKAEDVVITQYKADPSGAPFGVAIEKGFFKQAGIDITGVISGAGGARMVDGENLLTQQMAQPVGNNPQGHVHGAAGRRIRYDLHRSVGVVSGQGRYCADSPQR